MGAGDRYDPRGSGWVGAPGLTERDRRQPDALRRDYVFGRAPSLPGERAAGLYRLTLVTGDMEFGDHVLRASVDAAGVDLPELRQQAAEFSTLTATVAVQKGTLDITFRSPTENWVLNALTLEPIAKPEKTAVTRRIIDPYKKVEWQYATPAFAHAAALLAAEAGRKDLLEPAAKALDWSARTLSERRAASQHEDFFAPPLAHAIPLLKPLVPAARSARWEADVRRFDPYRTYRAGVGQGNWNVVALSGEALFHRMGLRDHQRFVEDSLAGQGRAFSSPWGLYLEGPMAYDHFPRLWAADMVAHGFAGKYADALREVLRRASLTSLLMQSPAGELPAGGRSAHHQWNEAEQCVTYEIYAARARADGDPELAAVFKRAAHLALGSMKRWIRPSGEMWIVKNRVDPARFHGYEGYSAHSQYNLLPMSMLAIAYEHAGATEAIREKPAPADLGGYVLQIDPFLHKVFANAGGMYIEIDTSADHHYDATGLIRIHKKGFDPQLGPSESLSEHARHHLPAGPKVTAGIGAAWKGTDGTWRRVGDLDKTAITKVSLTDVSETTGKVSFRLLYEGSFSGPSRISERYVVTPGRVELTTEIPGYAGPLRYVWPILADDGAQKTAIAVKDGTVFGTLHGDTQTFTPVGAAAVRVEKNLYPNRNGWARLGVAEYPAGGSITLRIEPRAEAPSAGP